MDNPVPRIKPGSLFLAWMITSLGFPFGGVLALSLGGPMDNVVSAALGGLLAGAVVGGAQWLVLRNYFGIDFVWALATASGLALGNTVGLILTNSGRGIGDLLIVGVVAGFTVGTAQWALLRERLSLAGAWVPVLALAWPLGWTTTWSIGVDVTIGYPVFGAIGALVFAAITGATLMFLVRNLSRTPTTGASEKGSRVT